MGICCRQVTVSNSGSFRKLRQFDTLADAGYDRVMKRKPAKPIEVPTSDVTALLRPYSSGWVALSQSQRRVVASGTTLEEAHRKAQEQGYPHPLYVKVIPPSRGYLPVAQ